jgi:hypothetical protein
MVILNRTYSCVNKTRVIIDMAIKSLIKEELRRLLKEKAPPGKKYEEMVLALKKEHGEDSPKPFAIAWAAFNKDKKKSQDENTKAINNGLSATWDQLYENEEPLDSDQVLELIRWAKTQKEKIDTAKTHLKFIGRGEGRAVFSLNDSQVLKLAVDKGGLGQNKNEALTFDSLKSNDMEDVVPYIFSKGNGYSYLVCEFARPVTESEFESKAGLPWEMYESDLESYYAAYKNNMYEPGLDSTVDFSDLESGETFSSRTEYEEWRTDEDGELIVTGQEDIREVPEFIGKMIDVIAQGELLLGDLLRLDHYGLTLDDRLVLIDSGFSMTSVLGRIYGEV